MQAEKKIDSWFVSPAIRESFGAESETFLSVKNFTKKKTDQKTYPPTGKMNC